MPAMREIRVAEAQAMFDELLGTVAEGESIAITRRGQNVAFLIPPRDFELNQRRSAVDRFRDRRRGWRKIGISTDEILKARHEGHRF